MKKIMIALGLTAAIMTLIVFVYSGEHGAMQVQSRVIQTKNYDSVTEAEGIISEQIRAEATGLDGTIATNILVGEGDRVVKGQKMITLSNGSSITSPIDGFVRNILTEIGYPTANNVAAAVVSDGDCLIARVQVSEKDIEKIQLGVHAEITCDATPGVVYSGHVEKISETAKKVYSAASSKTVVEVDIAMDDPTGLRPAYTANAKITLASREDAILVPFDVIVTRDGQTGVYLYAEDGVRFQPVIIGEELESDTEITGGLSPGDRVILYPDEITQDMIK